MSKIQTVWVYADAAERYADLIAGARRFGAVVNAVVPCESCAAELRACGPAAVYNPVSYTHLTLPTIYSV